MTTLVYQPVMKASKAAFVTGGSSGIGLATTRLFVKEGEHVPVAGKRNNSIAH
jgi:NAD(P)-dependent dehydrogenase (short-subunit alcohol dehydrogenase family)